MQIANPLKLYDSFLLDYIFNPIAWNAEWYFGKKPPFLALHSILFFGTFVVVGVILHTPINVVWLLSTLVFLTCIYYLMGNLFTKKYYANTKTGANRLRNDHLAVRLVVHLTAVALSVYVYFLTSDFVFNRSFPSMTFVIGFTGVATLPIYFLACDAMPPGFRQSAPKEA